MALFSLIERDAIENKTVSIITRKPISETVKSVKMSNKKNFQLMIDDIQKLIDNKLGEYKKGCAVCYEKTALLNYIEKANENGYIAIDTETTGLEPLRDEIIGASFYTKGEKAIYVPIGHINHLTYVKRKNQMSVEDLRDCLEKITAKVIMHNGKFDIRFIKNFIKCNIECYFDTMIAERLIMNGRDESAGLKKAYSRRKQLKNEVLSFDSYFEGLKFNIIPIDLAYVYAAMDAKFTYELFEMQQNILENPIFEALNALFKYIEMPILHVVIDMEERGILFDKEYNSKLKTEFENNLKIKENELNDILKEYEIDIKNYRLVNNKLSNPINFNSPTQIAIVLYDILNIKSNDRKTGENVIKEYKHPFCQKLLEYREINKILTTYLIGLEERVIENKIHTNFNQMGTVTGRFSSNEPNLQNIPNMKGIRQIFKADENKYLISCDYSGQEPRIVAHLTGDSVMIQAYKDKKDFYAYLASVAYKRQYEKCLEGYIENGKKVGKEIRDTSKKCFLGVCYGMGVNHLASGLNVDVETAQDALNKIYKACPGLLMLKQESIEFGRNYGYVETLWGRRRYIENINLPRYEFEFGKDFELPFDALDFENEKDNNVYINQIKAEWLTRLSKARGFTQINAIIKMAASEGVIIHSNGSKIAECERFAVNTRVQGTAADMTKQAMILLNNDKQLKKYGFELLLTVHDEVIGQFNKEYVSEVNERVKYLMLIPTEDLIVPFSCDTVIYESWDGEPVKI